jgi:hypothetical protein
MLGGGNNKQTRMEELPDLCMLGGGNNKQTRMEELPDLCMQVTTRGA